MNVRKRFLIALAISFALHFLVITGPGWHLPSLADLLNHDDESMLEAHLVTPPPVRPAHKPRPRAPRPPAPDSTPIPTPPPPAEPAKVSPDGTPSEQPSNDVSTVDDSGGPASITALRSDFALPRFVRIRYRVTLANGFPVGTAIQELRHDGEVYSLRSAAATSGIVALFKPANIVDISEGEIVGGSFRPYEFRIERNGGVTEMAHFDWDRGTVTLPSGRDVPLPAHAQDMLSMFCQLALLPMNAEVISIPVLTSKVVERYDFSVLGEETIATPRGERRAVHLRNTQANGVEATEVWLGLDDARLPIRIRHTNRQGETFEQVADSIEYEERKEGAR